MEKLMTPIESVDPGWTKVVSRKQKPADRADNMVAVYVEDESYAADTAISRRRSNYYGDGGDDEIAARDENLKAEETKTLKPNKEKEEKKKPQVSLLEAAENICPSYLEIYLNKVTEAYHPRSGFLLLEFVDFFDRALYAVRFSFPEIFKEPPSFKLNDVIDVPFSHFPNSVYKTSSRWINTHPIFMLGGFVVWAFEQIRSFLAPEQRGPPRTSKSQVSIFVALAMVLRSKPNVMIAVLSIMRKRGYLGPDDFPVIVWMMAQASQSDLSIGLFLWVHSLLPLVGNNPQTRDLILQLVEKILSNPKARTILVNNPSRAGQRVIPPPSFEILLRLTFPASSASVKATKRFEAIYSLLKEVALAGAPGSKAVKQVTQQIFTFSLKLAQEGNPVLAKEATAIAIWCVTKNVDCCKHWDSLYKENLGASVAVLKKLVDEWKDHSLKLSSQRSYTLTLNRTIKSFRLKNEIAITEGGVNSSLYKEADESCKMILGRLSRGSCRLKGTAITAVVIAAAVVLSFNLWRLQAGLIGSAPIVQCNHHSFEELREKYHYPCFSFARSCFWVLFT